jgi:IS1 transposase
MRFESGCVNAGEQVTINGLKKGKQNHICVDCGRQFVEVYGHLAATVKCLNANGSKEIICKTSRTRVEGENTRLRHDLARLHRKTLCYSKSAEMLAHSIRWAVPRRRRRRLHDLKFGDVPAPA